MKRLNFVLCLVCTLAISSAARAATLRTVALSGQQVPGAPDGTIFGSFSGLSVSQPPVLNDAGQTAFYASASNFGQGIWSEGGGSLSLVAAVGQQAPGMPDGVTYGHFGERSRIVINDTGLTAFGASVIEPDGGIGAYGIWSSGPGGSALVALSGQQAAGMLYGLDDLISLRTFLFNDAGQVAFQGFVSGGRGILAQRQGNLELVAHTGSHAPGTPDGVNFREFGNIAEFTLNKTGQTAFYGELTGSGVDATNDVGVWSEGTGSLALVARKGSQAPGMPDGAVFNPLNSIFRPDLNNAGQTAFASFVTGGGVDSTNNSGIWLGTAGSLSLAVRTGDPAPGAPSGATFASLGSLALNDAGQIAITAGLTEPGVDSTNRLGLWSGDPGSLALVARTGDHAPGTEDGVVFGGFTSTSAGVALILNAAGQTAFVGRLTGSGISASNDLGIWATDRSGALQLIAREGDPLEVAPGDFRTVRELYFISRRSNPIYPTGNSDGRPSAFNNWGQLAFQAQFTDGTGGIFVSNRVAVPEPSAITLIAAGLLGLVGCAPRRQQHRFNQQSGRSTTTLRTRRSDGGLFVSFVVRILSGFRETNPGPRRMKWWRNTILWIFPEPLPPGTSH